MFLVIYKKILFFLFFLKLKTRIWIRTSTILLGLIGPICYYLLIKTEREERFSPVTDIEILSIHPSVCLFSSARESNVDPFFLLLLSALLSFFSLFLVLLLFFFFLTDQSVFHWHQWYTNMDAGTCENIVFDPFVPLLPRGEPRLRWPGARCPRQAKSWHLVIFPLFAISLPPFFIFCLLMFSKLPIPAFPAANLHCSPIKSRHSPFRSLRVTIPSRTTPVSWDLATDWLVFFEFLKAIAASLLHCWNLKFSSLYSLFRE